MSDLVSARWTICNEAEALSKGISADLARLQSKMSHIGHRLGITSEDKFGAAEFLMKKTSNSMFEIDIRIKKLRDLCTAIAMLEKMENEE